MAPHRGSTILFLLVFVTAASSPATAKRLPSLRPLQETLAALTRPSVCVTRRAATLANLAKQIAQPACKAFPLSRTCNALRHALEAARRKRCGAVPSGFRVKAALRRLERAANAQAGARGLRPPFATRVFEPAGVVPHVTLVVLHGIGGDRDSVAATLRLAMQTGALRAARVLFPLAPVRETSRGAVPAWFDDAVTTTGRRRWDRAQLAAGARNVSRLLDNDAALFGTDRWRAAVGGFSQGAAMALTTALRHRVSAVASLAGFLPEPGAYPASGDALSRRSPAVIVHGDADKIVPLGTGRASADGIARLGRDTTFVVLKGAPHDFGTSVAEAVEVAYSAVSREMFPGWTGRDVAPPPLEWNLNL